MDAWPHGCADGRLPGLSYFIVDNGSGLPPIRRPPGRLNDARANEAVYLTEGVSTAQRHLHILPAIIRFDHERREINEILDGWFSCFSSLSWL